MKLKEKFATIFGSSLIAQAIQFFGILILARLYDPEIFGEYGFYAGIASVVAVISGLRFDYLAFAEKVNSTDHGSYIKLAIFVALVFSISSLLLSAFVRPHFSGYANFELWILFFVTSTGIFHIGSQSVLLRENYSRFGQYRIAQATLQIVLSCGLFFLLPKEGLQFGMAGSQLVIGVLMLLWFFRQMKRHVPVVSASRVWKDHKKSAFLNSFFTGLQYSTPFTPILFGAIYFSKSEVGSYFVIAQVFAAPLTILRRSLISLYTIEFSSIDKLANFIANRKSLLKRLLMIAILTVVLALLILHFFGFSLMTFALGEKWSGYSAMVVPIAVYFLIDTALQPFTTLLPLWQRTALAIKTEILRFGILFVGGFFFVKIANPSFIEFVLFFFSVMAGMYLLQIAFIVSMLRGRMPPEAT